MDQPSASGPAGTDQRHLGFALGKEYFGVPLHNVKEVIAVPPVTPLPQTPPHVLGILNLRGRVLTVIDLRKKLGIAPAPKAAGALIICEIASQWFAVVVDSIQTVLTPASAEMLRKPPLQTTLDSAYITSIYHQDSKLILFLDLACLLRGDLRPRTGQAA